MDLNQLYFRHQLSLMRARLAFDAETRLGHQVNAAGIARSIGAFQRFLGAKAASSWYPEFAQ